MQVSQAERRCNIVKWSPDVRALMERVLGEVVAQPTDLETARLLTNGGAMEEMSVRAELEACSRSRGYQS